MIKIILAGTPQISANVFEKIIEEFDVLAIISKPDNRVGRGKKYKNTPVKEMALKHNIKLFQPEKIIDIYDEIVNLDFDVFLTFSYGEIIPEKFLEIKKNKFINIHGSLLPKYRGAAPIQRAIMNGEKITGISLIYMVKKMDAGDVIFQKEIEIENEDTSSLLFNKFEINILNLINEWIKKFHEGDFIPKKQDENKVTFANKLSKEEAFLKIDESIKMINKVNAFNSNPGAYIFSSNKRIKIFKCGYEKLINSIMIETLDKPIYAYEYQYEGKKRIKVN